MAEAALVVSVGSVLVILVALLLGRSLSIRLGQMNATVEGIDRAVNHRAEGEPPLVAQIDTAVADIATVRCVAERTEQAVEANTGRLTAVEQRVGGIEGRLGSCEGELHHIRGQLGGG